MPITLSPKTQMLIETRMKECGFESSDEFLQMVVRHFVLEETEYYEDLDAETRAAIEEAERQPDISAEQVHDQLMRRYGGGT